MTGLVCYDRDGKPIGPLRWAELFEDWEYRQIGDTYIGSYRVSTVWDGLNHNWGDGPPLIFETMVFAAGTPYDLDCRRYATEEQARAGHDECVLLLRATVQTFVEIDPDDYRLSTEQEER